MKKEIKVAVGSNLDEIKNRGGYFEKFKNAPIPDNELLTNLGLFINRQSLSRVIFMNELSNFRDVYQRIIEHVSDDTVAHYFSILDLEDTDLYFRHIISEPDNFVLVH